MFYTFEQCMIRFAKESLVIYLVRWNSKLNLKKKSNQNKNKNNSKSSIFFFRFDNNIEVSCFPNLYCICASLNKEFLCYWPRLSFSLQIDLILHMGL